MLGGPIYALLQVANAPGVLEQNPLLLDSIPKPPLLLREHHRKQERCIGCPVLQNHAKGLACELCGVGHGERPRRPSGVAPLLDVERNPRRLDCVLNVTPFACHVGFFPSPLVEGAQPVRVCFFGVLVHLDPMTAREGRGDELEQLYVCSSREHACSQYEVHAGALRARKICRAISTSSEKTVGGHGGSGRAGGSNRIARGTPLPSSNRCTQWTITSSGDSRFWSTASWTCRSRFSLCVSMTRRGRSEPAPLETAWTKTFASSASAAGCKGASGCSIAMTRPRASPRFTRARRRRGARAWPTPDPTSRTCRGRPSSKAATSETSAPSGRTSMR